MELKYLRAFIVLVAGLITSIYSILNGISVTESLIRLLIVLVVFYIIGSIVIYALRSITNKAKKNFVDKEKERIAKLTEENEK